MTDKLTLQDCFKYPEAEIRHNSGGSFKDVFELIIRSYDANMSTLYMLADYDCKLILRDISELTDEERKHILNNFIFDLYIDTVGISEIVWNNFDDLLACCEHRKESIDYLRSINIDIDGFLQSGKAVKG